MNYVWSNVLESKVMTRTIRLSTGPRLLLHSRIEVSARFVDNLQHGLRNWSDLHLLCGMHVRTSDAPNIESHTAFYTVTVVSEQNTSCRSKSCSCCWAEATGRTRAGERRSHLHGPRIGERNQNWQRWNFRSALTDESGGILWWFNDLSTKNIIGINKRHFASTVQATSM